MNESRGLIVVIVLLIAVLVGLLQKGSVNAKLAAAVLFPYFLGRMLWAGILELKGEWRNHDQV